MRDQVRFDFLSVDLFTAAIDQVFDSSFDNEVPGLVEPLDTESRNCLPAGVASKAATYSACATADPPDRRPEPGETTSPHEAADGRGPGLGD